MNGLPSSMRVMSFLMSHSQIDRPAGFVGHAHALDHAAVLGFGGFGAFQRGAQLCGFVARAHASASASASACDLRMFALPKKPVTMIAKTVTE